MTRGRKRQKFSTPPRDIVSKEPAQKHVSTPTRAAVLGAAYFYEQTRQPCSTKDLATIFNILERTCRRILSSRRARQLQNLDDPDTRGHPRTLKNLEADAIASYIDNSTFDEKGEDWETIANKSTVDEDARGLLRVIYWRRVKEVADIKTYVAAIRQDHPPKRRTHRIEWYIEQLELRPHGVHWRRVVWSDEIYWSTGPRYTKRVKRRRGERDLVKNVQYNKNQYPMPYEVEEFYIFAVIGYNFSWAIQYNVGNKNGKMNARTYLQILPEL